MQPQDGQVCAAADSEETRGCARPGAGPYCGWAHWGSWSSCSRQCKLGVRHRKRWLTELAAPPHPALGVVNFSGQVPTPMPVTTQAPRVVCINLGKCMENGAKDADCCAKPHLASCTKG